uniref:LAGLIDADG type homing endonuclease n=2 Tax=Trametes TaxID=5324 RepID=A0A2L2FNL9_TRAHI|nr:LAGLIDADG type homing endonuclease [Trametes hirsuta]AVG72796.1 LAGLIDADG type homing endonuclease [Trametes hirsuta]
MNKIIKEILVGNLLGDASIKRTLSGKSYVTFEQSTKKSDYLNYLYEIVKENGIPLKKDHVTTYSRFDERFGVTNQSLYFRTEAIEELNPLADLFLNESGKKIVPHNISEHLSERGLAHWIMDDGQRVARGGVTLCTDSFDSEEVGILREALTKNFNLITSIHNKKSKTGSVYERIYVNKDSLDSIKPTLSTHLHDSMLYKVNLDKNFKQDTEGFISDSDIISDIDIFDT